MGGSAKELFDTGCSFMDGNQLVSVRHRVSGWALTRGDQADTYSMYIREIARSLYQLKRQLEELEQAYELELPGEKRDDLERELYRVRMEYQKVKNILEGAKDSP